MMENLKPCPFCGELPEIDQGEYTYKVKDRIYWAVGCMNDDCEVDVETDNFDTKEEAIKVWNTRR